LAGDSGEWH
jgi:hypothetical protein